MKNEAVGGSTFFKGMFKRRCYQMCTLIFGNLVTYDFSGKQIDDDTKIQWVIVDFEIGNIADPNLVWPFRSKILLHQITSSIFLSLEIRTFGVRTNTVQIEFLHDF